MSSQVEQFDLVVVPFPLRTGQQQNVGQRWSSQMQQSGTSKSQDREVIAVILLINRRKPPAVLGDSQSLTVPGVNK